MNKPNEEENILDEFGYFEFDTIILYIICVLSKKLIFREISGDDGSFQFAQKGIDEHVFFCSLSMLVKYYGFALFRLSLSSKKFISEPF